MLGRIDSSSKCELIYVGNCKTNWGYCKSPNLGTYTHVEWWTREDLYQGLPE